MISDVSSSMFNDVSMSMFKDVSMDMLNVQWCAHRDMILSLIHI